MKTKTYTMADFAWTKWMPKDMARMAPKILAIKKERYAAVKHIAKEKRTFENTVFAIEASDYDINDDIARIELLLNVSPNKSLREAAKKTIDTLTKGMVEIEYDEELYHAFCEYAEKKEKLSGARKKLFDDRARGYRRMGFGLSAAKRNKLKKLTQRINKLSIEFDKNINDHNDHITLREKEAGGLSKDFLAGLSRDKSGKYIVTLEYPDIIPFLQNSTNEQKRKDILDKNLQKGGRRNMTILAELLRLRHEMAQTLGYKNYAEYATETRMAKNPKAVMRFIEGLIRKLRKGVAEDKQTLRDLKRKMTGDITAEISYYDLPSVALSYYREQHKRQHFGIDTTKVSEYFPLDVVRSGMFQIYEKLFSVRFIRLTGYPTWHKDVEVYAVKNTRNEETISYFMLDLHPREGKYGHAAAAPIVAGRIEKDKSGSEYYVAPITCMMTNFTKPTSRKPSLLTHEEVETFFHEFGHVVHGVLTKAPFESQSGTSVTRDFVEAPSQMLQNWVWQKETLKLLSGHYKNKKKKLPDRLLKKMIMTKNHMVAYSTMRQLVFALFDMKLHFGVARKDTAKIFDEETRDLLGLVMPKGAIFPAGFGHLVGYAAGYYGYMWSLVYAADMFTRFEKGGILNNKIGMAYRAEILEKGSSVDESELIKKFLGRKPSNKAFLKEIGL